MDLQSRTLRSLKVAIQDQTHQPTSFRRMNMRDSQAQPLCQLLVAVIDCLLLEEEGLYLVLQSDGIQSTVVGRAWWQEQRQLVTLCLQSGRGQWKGSGGGIYHLNAGFL